MLFVFVDLLVEFVATTKMHWQNVGQVNVAVVGAVVVVGAVGVGAKQAKHIDKQHERRRAKN